jgi:peptide/nickel transport system permease protein
MLLQVVLRRLLQFIPVLLGVTFITFAVLNLLPGSTALAILGQNATKQSVAQLEQQLGLNRPFFVRYGDWLGGLVRGNFGHSLITSQSIGTIMSQRAPVTIELIVLSILIAVLLAIPVAMLAAGKKGGLADRLSALLAMVGLSVPNFVVGFILILVVAVHLRILPASGFKPLGSGLFANLRTMILPSLSLSFLLFATYTRMLRADIAEQLATEDYVTAARSRGISQWLVLVRHVLRNSMLGLITVVGLNLGTLFGATVVIETVFALPGIGGLLYTSIGSKDIPTVEAVVVVLAVAVVLANLLTDLLYSVLDPRVRYGTAGT